MMLSGSADTITCIWEMLRNEDETPDEIAEVRRRLESLANSCTMRLLACLLTRTQEEADWKKRKENDAREVAVQLAMQSSPAPVTPTLTLVPPSPSSGRSQTTTAVATVSCHARLLESFFFSQQCAIFVQLYTTLFVIFRYFLNRSPP